MTCVNVPCLSSLVKVLKFLALICVLIGLVFAVAVMVTSRQGFGYRGFLAYAGAGVISGVLMFELAEVIRWMQKLYERFDLHDKIDK